MLSVFPAHLVVVTLAALLAVASVFGGCERSRANRLDAALVESRETVAQRDAEFAGSQADVQALRDRIGVQNAALDRLHDMGEAQQTRLGLADRQARVLRELSRTRVDAVIRQPPPATCDSTISMLRGYVPEVLSW